MRKLKIIQRHIFIIFLVVWVVISFTCFAQEQEREVYINYEGSIFSTRLDDVAVVFFVKSGEEIIYGLASYQEEITEQELEELELKIREIAEAFYVVLSPFLKTKRIPPDNIKIKIIDIQRLKYKLGERQESENNKSAISQIFSEVFPENLFSDNDLVLKTLIKLILPIPPPVVHKTFEALDEEKIHLLAFRIKL